MTQETHTIPDAVAESIGACVARSMEKLEQERQKPLNCFAHGEYQRGDACSVGNFSPVECPRCAIEREDASRKARRMDYIEHVSGLPRRFRGREFDSLMSAHEKTAKAISSVRSYVDDFPSHLDGGRSLIFYGSTGTGKTLLACIACENIIMRHGKRCRYTTAYHLVRDIKASFGRGSDLSEEEIVRGFVAPDLLVVDEVGVQFGTDTEKMLLFEVINGRYESMRPTIVISNLKRNEIGEYLGDRVMDRLKENGGAALAFDWPSYRQ